MVINQFRKMKQEQQKAITKKNYLKIEQLNDAFWNAYKNAESYERANIEVTKQLDVFIKELQEMKKDYEK